MTVFKVLDISSSPAGITLDTLDNLSVCRLDAIPSFDLDPLSFLKVFIVLEEMLDTLDILIGEVIGRLDVAIRRIKLVDGKGQQLCIAARFIVHIEHAYSAAPNDGA